METKVADGRHRLRKPQSDDSQLGRYLRNLIPQVTPVIFDGTDIDGFLPER